MDLSKLSDKELDVVESGDLSSLSDESFNVLESQVNNESSGAKIAEDKSKFNTQPFTDFFKGAAAGLAKNVPNMLDFEQKLLDIATLPSRTTFDINKNASIREKIMGENIKRNIAPVTNTVYGDMATKARNFIDDYAQTKKMSLFGKIPEAIGQAPAFILQAEMSGGKTAGLGVLGLIQGSKEGAIGEESAKQSGINMAMGQVFKAISGINPGPESNNAIKILATGSRATLGSITSGGVSAVSNGDLYSSDPDKFDRLITDMAAGALFTALPKGKPADLAKKVTELKTSQEKITNEFLGKIADNLDNNAGITFSEYWGKERPATTMFREVFKKPVKNYREAISTVENELRATGQDKATSINNSVSNIQSDPTLGLQSVMKSELQSPGGFNKQAAKVYSDKITLEKQKVGNNMSVLDAFKRQAELKLELNDDQMKALRRVPLSKTEKIANQTLIEDYGRVIGEVEPNFRRLGKRESTLITLKELLASKSSSYQVNPRAGFSWNEGVRSASYRAAGLQQSFIGSALNMAKDIILRGNPVEVMTKEIANLQAKIDKVSSLQAKKVLTEEKISNIKNQIMNVYNPNFSMKGKARTVSEEANISYETPTQLSIESRIGSQKQISGYDYRRFTMREPTSPPLQIPEYTGPQNVIPSGRTGNVRSTTKAFGDLEGEARVKRAIISRKYIKKT